MLSRKHKKARNKFVISGNSTCFHLDDEQQGLAHQAKRELELLSFQEQFEDFDQIDSQSKRFGRSHKLFEQSIRTTTSQKEQIKNPTKNTASRYLHPKGEMASKYRKEDQPVKLKRCDIMSNIRLGTCLTQASFYKNQESELSTRTSNLKKKENQSPNQTKNSTGVIKKRIHNGQWSLQKHKQLNSRNSSYFTNPTRHQAVKKRNNFFSFNDAIESYGSHRLSTPRESCKQQLQRSEDKKMAPETTRQQVALRPEFLRLIKKIKDKQQASNTEHKPWAISKQRK